MDLQKYRTHPGWQQPNGLPWGAMAQKKWRVFTKFSVFLLWFGGVQLGLNLLLLVRALLVGKTGLNVLAPVLGCVVAVLFVCSALSTSPKVDELAGE